MGTALIIHCVISTALPSTTAGSLSPDLESSVPAIEIRLTLTQCRTRFYHWDCLFLCITAMSAQVISSDESSDSASGHGGSPVPFNERPREIIYMRPPTRYLLTPDFNESFSEGSLHQRYPMRVLRLTPTVHLLNVWNASLTVSLQFISSRGNEYFCEIDEEYLTDRFNLTGLNTEVQYYQYALDLVTDVFDLDCDDEMRETIEKSARHLYGLVHARYIVTTRGLAKMVYLHIQDAIHINANFV